jgi:hypothetical protein
MVYDTVYGMVGVELEVVCVGSNKGYVKSCLRNPYGACKEVVCSL